MLLIVDDHHDSREVLVRLATIEGYEAIGVRTGTEALLFLKSHKPRLVVLDYAMPDLDGVAVLREMKNDPRLADIPVLMFSAFADERSINEALAAGASGYVVKASLDWADLRNEILRLAGPGKFSVPHEEEPQAPKLRRCEGS